MKASEFDLLNIDRKDREAVLLQSGGLDSLYLAHLLDYYHFRVHHIFVDYGQNTADKELYHAQKIAEKYNGTFNKVELKLPWLTEDVCKLNGGIATSVDASELDENYLGGVKTGIYVPMRNLMLIGIASSYAEAHKIPYIATGLDGLEDRHGKPMHGTPDKHPTFAIKLENALTESSALYHMDGKKFELLCPIIGNDKFDTVKAGLEIQCDFTDSWTCYNATEDGKPCLKCDSCLQRLYAFSDAGYQDPTIVKYYGEYENPETLLKSLGNPIDL